MRTAVERYRSERPNSTCTQNRAAHFLQRMDRRCQKQRGHHRAKTRSAARDVPLASFLVPLLRELHCSDPETYVLSGDRKCLEPKTYRTFYKRFLERNNLPMLRFHGLRHTFATLCIEDGADCKTVSALLGHASVNLTLSLYVHPQIEQKRKCIERLPVYESRRAARRF